MSAVSGLFAGATAKAAALALNALQPLGGGGGAASGSVGFMELAPETTTASLCARVLQAAAAVRLGCRRARASGVLTPALLAARRRARAKRPHLFPKGGRAGGDGGGDDDDDVVVLSDGAAEAASAYVAALKPLRFDAVGLLDDVACGAASHAFAAQALSAGGRAVQGSGKQRLARLASEVSQLSASLPVELGSSVFVRCDEARLDILKVKP
jgi:hypothetical protein